jgi:mono/diheme cytochrome c family protein
MKKGYTSQLLTSAIFTVLILSFMAFKSGTSSPQDKTKGEAQIEIPGDVSKIFDKACFECHNANTKSDNAKQGLLIDELPYLKKRKIVAKLDEIAAVTDGKKMPPKNFLKKYPKKALTGDEAKRLINWAEDTTEGLMK